MRSVTLFEYGNWEKITSIEQVRVITKNLWEGNLQSIPTEDSEKSSSNNSYQPFVAIDGDFVKANNFVGFLQTTDELLEIYPKVFRQVSNPDKRLMLKHVFYWLSYCRKWRFPYNRAGLNNMDVHSFPELFIFLFANELFEIVSTQPLLQYQECHEDLISPKGRILFENYSRNNIANARLDHLPCIYEPLMLDNLVNRAIKHCSRLLLNQTENSETMSLLQNIVFILDEVADVSITSKDLQSVAFSSFYESYIDAIAKCKFILDSQLYANDPENVTQWCLLLPMEYIFEDFFAGFLEKHFSFNWKIEYQKSDKFLCDEPRAFNMQHDIYLTSLPHRHCTIIIDTKYKLRDRLFKSDTKRGINQSDLYQMVSYAYKRGCTKAILVYPNIGEELNPPDFFKISSGFDGFPEIDIIALEIPFWSTNSFETLEARLIDTIIKFLNH